MLLPDLFNFINNFQIVKIFKTKGMLLDTRNDDFGMKYA